MTRDVDPRRLAVWTLERFAARFCEYAYEVYDQMDHPALGQSPREAFAQGMQLAGMRTHRLIPYSEEFLILTCPTTRTKYAKLDAARGVVVNGLRYYHPLMRFSKEAGKPVEVRYEPFDMSRAYAFVDGQWLTCAADAFLQVQGRSEREWGLILDEWREQQRVHQRKRVGIDSTRLAAFWKRFSPRKRYFLSNNAIWKVWPFAKRLLVRRTEPISKRTTPIWKWMMNLI